MPDKKKKMVHPHSQQPSRDPRRPTGDTSKGRKIMGRVVDIVGKQISKHEAERLLKKKKKKKKKR